MVESPPTAGLAELPHLATFATVAQQGSFTAAATTYGHWPAGMKHFVWAKGEPVLQFHGTGPWSIQYVNPEDDPRNQKK